MTEYTAPHNIEGEASLLGAMMMDNELIDSLLEIVEPDDFFEPVHQRIAAGIARFREKGRVANPVTLKPLFDRDDALATLGGVKYLMQLTSDAMGLLAPRQIADQIAELARIRRMRAAVSAMEADYMDGSRTFEEATGVVEEALAKALSKSAVPQAADGAEMLGRVMDRSERLTALDVDGQPGISTTTVSDLNKLLGTVEGPMYIVLGGRPSMGKTTAACSAAWGYAAAGHPTLYAFAEGNDTDLAVRFAADLSLETEMPIEQANIRDNKLTVAEKAHLAKLQERASTLPIDFQKVGRIDIARLRSHVARACSKWRERGQRLEILVIDYMQLFSASENGREITDDRRRINKVSEEIDRIAKDFNLVVIALSQLSRSLEQRDDKRPRMSDLRESGRIEEDADAIVFVYREEYYLERSRPEKSRKDYEAALQDWEVDLAAARDRVELICAKNRHGSVKTRKAKFYGKFTAVRGGDFAPPADTQFFND